MNKDIHNDLCSFCNSSVYIYISFKCRTGADQKCSYLNGWNMNMDHVGLMMYCCSYGWIDRGRDKGVILY